MKEIFDNLQYRLTELALVFEKAQNNEMISSMIEELKENAFNEARTNCHYLLIDNKPLSAEQFENLDASTKSEVICTLGSIGLDEFIPNSFEGKINIKFSIHIQRVLSCTMFVILNKLENLDGAINVLSPEVQISVKAPLGGKKGLAKCYMLIQALYPWCKGIREVSSNEVSVDIPSELVVEKNAPDKTEKKLTESKTSFWSKIFKK